MDHWGIYQTFALPVVKSTVWKLDPSICIADMNSEKGLFSFRANEPGDSHPCVSQFNSFNTSLDAKTGGNLYKSAGTKLKKHALLRAGPMGLHLSLSELPLLPTRRASSSNCILIFNVLLNRRKRLYSSCAEFKCSGMCYN